MSRSENISGASESEGDAEAHALVTETEQVEALAAEIAGSGRFAFDLEFASDGRYIPDLALVQLAWGPAEEPEIAVVDCVTADPSAVIALVADEQIETVAHAAKQDLGLLAARYAVTARSLWDTQIAAAFLGIGEQVGYAKLASRFAGVRLDKGSQYTKWLQRPLTPAQLRYAFNDVRYLLLAWQGMRAELQERGRLGWVREESERLSRSSAYLPADDDAYVEVRGWKRLDAEAVGALRSLAAWRQATARSRNKPLSWVLPERAMTDICRARPTSTGDLRRVKGIGDGTVRRSGRAILAAVLKGAAEPLQAPKRSRKQSLSERGETWAGVVAQVVHARCAESGIAPRFVGTRADVEALVTWFESGDRAARPDIGLLHGWRRELAGDAVLDWLEGRSAIAVGTSGPASLTVVAVAAPDRPPDSLRDTPDSDS